LELTSAAADHGMRLQAARVLLLLRPAGNRRGSSIIDPRSRSEVVLSSLAARSNIPPAALSELSTRAIRSNASAAAFVCRSRHEGVEHVAQLVMQRHFDRPKTVAAGPGAAWDRRKRRDRRERSLVWERMRQWLGFHGPPASTSPDLCPSLRALRRRVHRV
jgi:hypothetical protein